jgi:hypothetical protein
MRNSQNAPNARCGREESAVGLVVFIKHLPERYSEYIREQVLTTTWDSTDGTMSPLASSLPCTFPAAWLAQTLARMLRFALLFLAVEMSRSVTARAKGNEVFFGIITEPATRSDVVDLKIPRRAAILAAPPIAHEHLAGELAIRFRLKP